MVVIKIYVGVKVSLRMKWILPFSFRQDVTADTTYDVQKLAIDTRNMLWIFDKV